MDTRAASSVIPKTITGDSIAEFVTGIVAISKDMAQPGKAPLHGFEDIDGAIAILNISGVHEDED
ncbi:hypothetical protein FHW92_005128 [Novosphingobium sp. SG707]|nr:hypothetical protein [Novosphingobium sp. SG707]